MFEFNYSVGDIKNSNLGEWIICLWEGSGGKGEGSGEKGEGSGEKGKGSGGKWGGSGECLPPCPPSYINDTFLIYYLFSVGLFHLYHFRNDFYLPRISHITSGIGEQIAKYKIHGGEASRNNIRICSTTPCVSRDNSQ